LLAAIREKTFVGYNEIERTAHLCAGISHFITHPYPAGVSVSLPKIKKLFNFGRETETGTSLKSHLQQRLAILIPAVFYVVFSEMLIFANG